MKRLCLILGVAAAACGGGDGGGLTPEGFADQLGDAFCDKYVECGLIPAGVECIPPINSTDWTDVAVAEGRLDFDQATAAGCLSDFRGLECWQLFDEVGIDGYLEDCDDIITPAQTEGEPCFRSDECVVGTMCEQPLGCDFEMCCEGTCVVDANPPALPGDACDDAIGPYCDAPGACVNGVCEVGDAAGDPCYQQCAGNLFCDGSTDTCAPFPPGPTGLEGDPCEGTVSACAEPGVFCLGGTCGRFRDPGESCSELDIAMFCNPFAATCVDGTCVLNPTAGDACTQDGPECLFDLPCVDGVCMVPLPDGAACNTSDQCASEDCDGTCQPVLTCP